MRVTACSHSRSAMQTDSSSAKSLFHRPGSLRSEAAEAAAAAITPPAPSIGPPSSPIGVNSPPSLGRLVEVPPRRSASNWCCAIGGDESSVDSRLRASSAAPYSDSFLRFLASSSATLRKALSNAPLVLGPIGAVDVRLPSPLDLDSVGEIASVFEIDDDDLGETKASFGDESNLGAHLAFSSVAMRSRSSSRKSDTLLGFVGGGIELGEAARFGDEMSAGHIWQELLRAFDAFP